MNEQARDTGGLRVREPHDLHPVLHREDNGICGGCGAWWPCPYVRGFSQGAAHEERGLNVERLRSAFIKAGVVWVLPATLFDEAVAIVAREYAATSEAAPDEDLPPLSLAEETARIREAATPEAAPECRHPGCGLPEHLHGAPPGEPPNPTRSTHRFSLATPTPTTEEPER